MSFSIVSSCTYIKGSKKQDVREQGRTTAEVSGQSEQKVSEAPQKAREPEKSLSTKEPSRAKLIPDSGVIDMTETEVKKKFGEPDIVSKMPDGRILWTYQPTWKLLPDNKGTVYIEFENGKVVKIIRTR